MSWEGVHLSEAILSWYKFQPREMRWLLSKLGLSKKHSDFINQDSEDTSFFTVNRLDRSLRCQWKIRPATQRMIDQDFGSRLFLRIRDVSKHNSNSLKIIELSLETTELKIGLPVSNGRILVDLGYRFGVDFITLEYQLLDLGPIVDRAPKHIDWFQGESNNIHEEMYNLAHGFNPLGGSEISQ